MFFGNLHFKISLIFRGQNLLWESRELQSGAIKMQNNLLLLPWRKYLLRKHRKKFHWHFFSEKNFPHELLGIVGSFLICCLGPCFGIFVKKIFSFLWAGPFGLYQTQRLYSFRKNFVNRLYRLFTLNSKCNCVTAFSQKIKSLPTQIYQFQEYLVNHFQY